MNRHPILYKITLLLIHEPETYIPIALDQSSKQIRGDQRTF